MQETASAAALRVANRDLEPISPELVLVSPPEIARRARQLLPESPPGGVPTSPVDSAAVEPIADAAPPVLGLRLVEVPPPRGPRVPRATAAVVVLVAIATGATGFVAGKYGGGAELPGQARLAGYVLPLSPTVPARNASSASESERAIRAAPPRASASARPRRPRAPRRSKAQVKHAPPVNSASSTRSIPSRSHSRPAKTSPSRASTSSTFVPSRAFAWPARRDATSYIVRFFRNGKKVIEARSTKPHLTLPASFRFAAGRYRWQVIPALGPSASPRYGPPIVESTFVLTAATAAKAGS